MEKFNRPDTHRDRSKEDQESVWMPCADCPTPVQCTESEDCVRLLLDEMTHIAQSNGEYND